MSESSNIVDDAYEKAQTLKLDETRTSNDELQKLSDNWKDKSIPELQRQVVDLQLEDLRKGVVDPAFTALAEALKAIPLESFSLLDGAAASGYYREVIRTLDPRAIDYQGGDYSEAMVNTARANYPEISFEVQDLTQLTYLDASFDVFLLAGVLEHIPLYKKAVSEACRVARKYIILHRAPVTDAPEHCHTIGSQYNIQTPRTWFSKKLLLSEFKANGYGVIWEGEVYPEIIPFSQKIKQAAKRLLGKNPGEKRTIKTLVFCRKS